MTKGVRNLVTAGLFGLLLAATPTGVRSQQDSTSIPTIRDTTCVDTADTTRGPEHQKVRPRISMDHNEVAAPRVDNIPLEGTDKGFIPIPGTASDSVPARACPAKTKTKISRDSVG